jgi:hypothetical protein
MGACIWVRNFRYARTYFFLACDLNEIPRRIVRLFILPGVRPVILTTSSKVFEVRASSINRRSSLNDQRRMAINKNLLFRTKPPSGVCSPDGFAGVGPDFGEIVRRLNR